MLKKILFLLSLLLLVGCDDSSGDIASAEQQIEMLSSVDGLPECVDDNEGAVVSVKGENSARVCVEGKWQFVAKPFKDTVSVEKYTVYAKGEDIECSTKELADKSGIKVICNGDSIGVVYNGRNGKDGADGKDGKNGANGKEGPQGKKGDKGDAGSAGAAGSDGENGNDGTNGSDGKDGETCKLTDDKAGRVVVVVCGKDSVTLYKALCGEKPYNPESHFCASELVYERCGGAAYDVESYFCIDDSLSLKCEKNRGTPKITCVMLETVVCIKLFFRE